MKDIKYILFIIFIIGFFLTATFRAVSGNPSNEKILTSLKNPGLTFESSQERARYALVKSMVDDQTLKLDKYVELALPDLSNKSGNFISIFPPGLSLIVAPAYYFGEKLNNPVIFVFAMPVLFSILTSVYLYLLCKEVGVKRLNSFLAAIIFALGTTSWNYSVTLYAHNFSAFCLTAGIFYAIKAKEGSAWNHLLVWSLYGLSILIDYPNAIIFSPIILYMIFNSFSLKKTGDVAKVRFNWRILYTVFPFLILLSVLGYYNFLTLGSWYDLAHNYRITSLNSIVSDSSRYLVGNIFKLDFFLSGLKTLLISKGRGLVLFSPILLFSIFGLIKAYKTFPEKANLFVAVIISNIFLYSLFYDPWGGWAYGPRYLIPTMPLLALFAAYAYEKYCKNALFLTIFSFCFFFSFAVSLLGVLTTNLLVPFPETGVDTGYVSLIPILGNNQSGSLIFNLISNKIPLNITTKEYFALLSTAFAVYLLPVFLHQLLSNILTFFKKIFSLIFIPRKEVGHAGS